MIQLPVYKQLTLDRHLKAHLKKALPEKPVITLCNNTLYVHTYLLNAKY